MADGIPGWVRRFAGVFPPRVMRLLVTMTAGLLMCISFPPIGWWWSAVASFALLSWVLTHPRTTLAGGFGYGLLFGLAFYIPLLPWISGLVGPVPWLMLATLQALFVAVFGMFAVTVRRLPGWPVWLALLWALQERLKSSLPFGGFPWGVVGFGQANGPFL
jgi:apolipoprotein N-acyltransferase